MLFDNLSPQANLSEYTDDSKGAFLFEEFYSNLLKEVFGANGIGEDVISFFSAQSVIFFDFYENFDRILLSEKSIWFKGRARI